MGIDANDLGDWRYGLHPDGPGAVIGEMTRISLPLGDALRLEMTKLWVRWCRPRPVLHRQRIRCAGRMDLVPTVPTQGALALLEAIEPPGSHEPR